MQANESFSLGDGLARTPEAEASATQLLPLWFEQNFDERLGGT